jgi:hypothetical protein
MVQLANWEAAREAAGVDQPAPDADPDEIIEYVRALEERGVVAVSEYEYAGRAVALRDEMGFSAADLDASASSGEPPDIAVVFAGRIDEDAVAEAVAEDPRFGDVVEEVEAEGRPYWSWGEDGAIDVESVSDLRRIGESLRLAVVDGGAVLTRLADTMEDHLALEGGEGRSLADDEDVSAVAAVLDDQGALAALIADEPLGFDPSIVGRADDPGVVEELLEEAAALPTYRVFGTGVADVDGRSTLVVVLVYGDAETAAEAVPVLQARFDEGESFATRQPWTELVTDAEVVADGRVVIATGTVERPNLWQQVVFRRDSLLVVA